MTKALFLLAVVHLGDYGNTTPDHIEYVHAYENIDQCWAAAYELSQEHDAGEAIVVCLEDE
jgi:hypothetical protein